MKCVPTLAYDPVPNIIPAELSRPRFPNLDTLVKESQTLCLRCSRNLVSPIWTPLLKNATSATDPYLNVYSTSLTPYACTCRDSMHMRRMLHLATLVLFADRFVISPLVLSTFYFLLPTLYFMLCSFYFVYSLRNHWTVYCC